MSEGKCKFGHIAHVTGSILGERELWAPPPPRKAYEEVFIAATAKVTALMVNGGAGLLYAYNTCRNAEQRSVEPGAANKQYCGENQIKIHTQTESATRRAQTNYVELFVKSLTARGRHHRQPMLVLVLALVVTVLVLVVVGMIVMIVVGRSRTRVQ